MTIGKKIGLSFAAIVTLLLVLTGVSLLSLSRLSGSLNAIGHGALPGSYHAGRVAALTGEQRALFISYVTAETQQEMQGFEDDLVKLASDLRSEMSAYAATLTSAEDRKRWQAFLAAHERVGEVWSSIQTLRREQKAKEAFDLWRSEGLPRARARAQTVDVVTKFETEQGDLSVAEGERTASGAKWTMWICSVVALSLAAALAAFIIRSINKALTGAVTELREGANQVASASGQVATSSQTLAQGASQQAASVEETSASIEQITAMARRNADSSRQAASIVEAVVVEVGTTNTTLGSMTTSMNGIEAASIKMGRIIKVIDEIAFQTNILALNAAVEAARAGDLGMGFAVVADEVRNLARRSAEAAKETAILIEESITTSKEGVLHLSKVVESVAGITGHSSDLKRLIDEVSHASHDQATGAQEIAVAMTRMDKVTQSVAASSEESAAAAEQLSSQASTVMDVVRQLDGMVHAR